MLGAGCTYTVRLQDARWWEGDTRAEQGTLSWNMSTLAYMRSPCTSVNTILKYVGSAPELLRYRPVGKQNCGSASAISFLFFDSG